MNDLRGTLKKGTLLIIETGEYSDRDWCGPVRMLKDAVKVDLAKEFKKSWTPEAEANYETGPDDFLPWLIKAGYAEDVADVHSWHVGSYGKFEP